MKMLIAALALAALIAAPSFTQPAAAARKAGGDAAAAHKAGPDACQSGQNYNGCYRGYPLEEWYRTDGW
jgi:hypothetical protein